MNVLDDKGNIIENVVATPDAQANWNAPLTVTLGTETSDGVYVALLPCGSSSEKVTFYFSVTGSNGTSYTGTANAYLIAGRFYPVTITLTKV